MSRRLFAGLNIRLLLLVLLAMLPALGLLLYNAATERQRAEALVRNDTERLARLTAAQVGQIIEGQRQLLVALASLDPVLAQDANACRQTFAKLRDEYPFYSGLGASTPDGTVFCSSATLNSAISVADRAWFQRAIATSDFALGDYQKGRVTGADVIVGAYPAYSATGELRAVVSVSLNLTWLDKILADAQLPSGAAVNITDHAGTLLSRYPDPTAWVGQKLGEGPLLDFMLVNRAGTTELAGPDGISRLYAFEPVATSGGGKLHVAVGIPSAVAYAAVESALTRNLVAMGIAAVVALALTRAAAEVLVLRHARKLAGLTQRLAAGDLQARSGGPYGGSELDRLAQAFDQMAASLEAREGQLRQALRSLEMLSACNQALVRSADTPTLLEDICRNIVEVGGYRLAWIGFPETDAAGRARWNVAAQAGDDLAHQVQSRVQPAPTSGLSPIQPSSFIPHPSSFNSYLARLDLDMSDGGSRRHPAEVALRAGEVVVTVLRHADAKGAPWLAQALAHGYQAAIALPIVVEGEIEGALSIFAAEANAFDERAVRLLTELAGDVAFGTHTLRQRAAKREAEAQLRRHADQADTLAEITRELVAVTTDEASVLDVIARRVALRLGDVCVIRLLSADGQWLIPAALYHPDPALLEDVRQVLAAAPQRADQGAAALVLSSGQALRTATVTLEQGRSQANPALWPLVERLGVHSVILMPLRTAAHSLGVLNVVRLAGSPAYTADDEAFAQELADRAALSISNARLYQSLQQLNTDLEARVAERTAALQRTSAEFEDLYDQAPCGYHSLDAEGNFLRVNEYEVKLLGYSRDELVGRMRFSDLLTPASVEVFKESYARFKATGQTINREYEMVSQAGQVIPVLLSASAIYDEAGRYLQSRATLVDITDRKQSEAQIETLNAVLAQRAQQLETANQELQAFSYSVSHDLRAPLRTIDGFSLALAEDYGGQLDETARDYLDRTRAAAQRMGDLIDALLVLSRVTRAELRRMRLNLSNLAEAVVGELRQREPERQVEMKVAPDLQAEGDPSLVRNVLENLLANAWKFTAGCQPARIELGCLDDPEAGRVYFVRDNGAGFDMTYAGRLFGAFQRLHDQKQFKGTGIGLASVQRIIVRHGGRVWGEGQVGAGATFYFTLP